MIIFVSLSDGIFFEDERCTQNDEQKMKKTIILSALAAFFFASMPLAQAQSKSFNMAKWVEVYNSILKELNRSYVDSLEVGRIQRAAIDAMLSSLDPYTQYIPEEEREKK